MKEWEKRLIQTGKLDQDKKKKSGSMKVVARLETCSCCQIFCYEGINSLAVLVPYVWQCEYFMFGSGATN